MSGQHPWLAGGPNAESTRVFALVSLTVTHAL